MRIIGFTGYTASGKSTSLEFLKHKGYYIVDLGQVIRDSYEQTDLKYRMDIVSFSIDTHNNFGKLWSLSKAYIDFRGYQKVAIGGIRFAEQITFLKEISTSFSLIYIESSEKNRLERFLKRKRSDFSPTQFDFELKEKLELEIWNIGDAISQSDYIIENDSILSDLHANLDKVISC
jgi:dephospho-CoA kinase